MTFKYSICYPDKEEIEYFNTIISKNQVIEIAKNYTWEEQLKLSDSLNQNKVYYSPSIDFNCIESGRSFCLTADYDKNKNLTFSLWYKRPKKVKILFGLFGEKEIMIVDDVSPFSLTEAIKYLKDFTEENYTVIEKLYQ